MIPGVNLLQVALGAIAPQGAQLRKFTGRATNSVGIDVATYAAAVAIEGSVQAVPRSRYQNLGLDFGKHYVMLYTTYTNIATTDRDTNGDAIEFAGGLWLCESDTDWATQDGWRSILCVQVQTL